MAKLQVETLTTVLYDRQKLCQSIGLSTARLPLLACLLGNDVVSDGEMQHIRDEATAIYRCTEFYFEVRFSLILKSLVTLRCVCVEIADVVKVTKMCDLTGRRLGRPSLMVLRGR